MFIRVIYEVNWTNSDGVLYPGALFEPFHEVKSGKKQEGLMFMEFLFIIIEGT